MAVLSVPYAQHIGIFAMLDQGSYDFMFATKSSIMQSPRALQIKARWKSCGNGQQQAGLAYVHLCAHGPMHL